MTNPLANIFLEVKHYINKLNKPFDTLEIENKFDVSVKVSGGGVKWTS